MNKSKVSKEIILFLIFILCILELIIFIILKAEIIHCYFMVFEEYLYIFDIINNLTLAYIMSYMFFVVALIPERRKQCSINKYVSIYLTHIIHYLDEIILVSNSFKSTGIKNLANSPSTMSVLRDTGRVEFLTYKEHFISFYDKFHEEYKFLSYYIAFIDDELRDCLYQIVTSEYMSRIHDFLMVGTSCEYDNVYISHYDDNMIITMNKELKHFANLGRGRT